MTGLYVHLPFCSALCPYCDFAVVVGRTEQHAPYVEALLREAQARAMPQRVVTVFVGGGTPSYMDAALVADLLVRLREAFEIAPDAEVTLEANPESVTGERAEAWRAAGVNRLSIGAQSFSDDALIALGRTHTAEQTAAAVAAARAAGFDNISLDLIYGARGDDWTRSLDEAIALRPEHVSCYALTIEERTAFGTAVAAGRMRAPEDDLLAEDYHLARERLGAAGYRQYEISNWGLPCAHNLLYWSQGDYAGLGLGAHSHRQGRRWWNTRKLAAYLAAPHEATAGEETLTPQQRAEEWLSLRLRMTEGFDRREAEERLGRRLPLEGLGDLLVIEGDKVRLTERGMLLENEVAGALLSLSTRTP